MSLLKEFAAHEEGWEHIDRRFRQAIATKTEQAATATDAEHADKRGQLRGWRDAHALLHEIRREESA